MYEVVQIEEKVRVPPTLAKMEVGDAIKEVLRQKYEGRVDKDMGLMIKVVDAKPVGSGTVILGDPNIYYTTRYKMLTFNVEVNEVFLAVVKDIMEFGAFVIIGPFEALLHISQISKERFVYDRKNKQLVSKDGKLKIKEGDLLYVKISTISMKERATDVKISVTMRDEGLYNLSWVKQKPRKKVKK